MLLASRKTIKFALLAFHALISASLDETSDGDPQELQRVATRDQLFHNNSRART